MVTITSNTWSDSGEGGIWVTSSCNVTITGNTFDPTADTGWKPLT